MLLILAVQRNWFAKLSVVNRSRLLTSMLTVVVYALAIFYEILYPHNEIHVMICLAFITLDSMFDGYPLETMSMTAGALTVIGVLDWIFGTPGYFSQNMINSVAAATIGCYLAWQRTHDKVLLLLQQERESALRDKETRTQLMLSQIRPHFLYNVLATIQALCASDPKKASEAVGWLCDVLRGILGLELAKHIKERSPATRILFCTAYSDYGVEAFSVQAVGYILKPVTEQKLRDAIAQVEELLGQTVPRHEKLRVQTFGNFEVFSANRPLVWERSKAKELFAYLIDRRGASVNNTEIAPALWEDDSKVRSVQTILASLRKTLARAGAADVLLRTFNRTSIDPKKVDCDLYDYLAGDVRAVNAYQGEYMTNYSWGEFTNGWLYSNHSTVAAATDVLRGDTEK